MKRTLVTGKRFIEISGINARTFYRYLKQKKLDYYTVEGKSKKWFDSGMKLLDLEKGIKRLR